MPFNVYVKRVTTELAVRHVSDEQANDTDEASQLVQQSWSDVEWSGDDVDRDTSESAFTAVRISKSAARLQPQPGISQG